MKFRSRYFWYYRNINQTKGVSYAVGRSVKALKELGHPTRLFIFKHLVKAGEQGLPVGELQKQLGIPGSTLSHHISALVSVGLVKQNRESRTLMCVSQYAMLEAIIEFLREECCVNSKIA